jgi:hypothetical protein
VQPLERVIPVARQLLTITIDDERRDLWLWERAERVMRLTQLLARIPEVANFSTDQAALGAAGLFHAAGWLTQIQQRRLNRWQVLARPTSDIQRELGAALLQEHVGALLPPKTARLAAEAVRQCNDRSTSLLEAQLLAEAENLDDMGTMYVLRQLRQCQGDARPLRQLVATWQRQQEYGYWEVRIRDGFRFETTRALARERLRAVAVFMEALARDLDGTDVLQALERAGMEPGPRPTDAE